MQTQTSSFFSPGFYTKFWRGNVNVGMWYLFQPYPFPVYLFLLKILLVSTCPQLVSSVSLQAVNRRHRGTERGQPLLFLLKFHILLQVLLLVCRFSQLTSVIPHMTWEELVAIFIIWRLQVDAEQSISMISLSFPAAISALLISH